jgi:purine-binding chemotaxis protein CheW
MTNNYKYCTFFLDDALFGIEVLKVQEVIRYQEMTQVPLASSVVRGLINLRGQIVTAIDLRQRLGLPPRSTDEWSMNVVARTGDGNVSFLVDEMGEVQEVQEEAFEHPPETIAPAVRGLVRGAYKLDDRLLLVLDVEQCAKLPVGL